MVVAGARTLPGGLYKEPGGRAAGPQLTQAQGWHCSRQAAVEEDHIGTRLQALWGAKGRPGPMNLGRKTEAGPEDAMAGGVSLLKVRPPCSGPIYLSCL